MFLWTGYLYLFDKDGNTVDLLNLLYYPFGESTVTANDR